jgi:Haem-binding domain
MARIVNIIFIFILLVLLGIQFIPIKKTNPIITQDIQAPAEVKSILRSSCYNCHSNETKWPWYSNFAPVSWMIINDVEDARNKLNFSTWNKISFEKKEELMKDIWDEIRQEDMPLTLYTYVHPESKLDLLQKNIIKKWITGTGIGD